MIPRFPSIVLLIAVSAFAQDSVGRQKRVVAPPAELIRGFDKDLRVAIVAGIAIYPRLSKFDPLEFAEDDAKAVASELRNLGYVINPNSELIGPDASKALVWEAVEKAAQHFRKINTRPDGTVASSGTFIFYFSGHGFAAPAPGVPDKTANYLATYNATQGSLASEGVSLSELHAAIDKIPARQRILWIDACRTNPAAVKEFLAKSPGVAKKTESRSFTTLERGNGTRTLYSTKEGLSSWEDRELKQSLFTHFLLRGLRGEAYGEDGLLTAQDLSAFVWENVTKYAYEKRGWDQEPRELVDASGDFLVGAKEEGLYRAYFADGIRLSQRRRYGEAEAAFSNALRIKVNDPAALYERGAVRKELANNVAGEQDWALARKLGYEFPRSAERLVIPGLPSTLTGVPAVVKPSDMQWNGVRFFAAQARNVPDEEKQFGDKFQNPKVVGWVLSLVGPESGRKLEFPIEYAWIHPDGTRQTNTRPSYRDATWKGSRHPLYMADAPLKPGRHTVEFSIAGRSIGKAGFEIEPPPVTSADLKLSSAQFYEASAWGADEKERKYGSVFPDTTKAIHWKLFIDGPAAGRKLEFRIDLTVKAPDGSSRELSVNSYRDPDWKSSWQLGTVGMAPWKPGLHSVVFKIDGRSIGERTFEISRASDTQSAFKISAVRFFTMPKLDAPQSDWNYGSRFPSGSSVYWLLTLQGPSGSAISRVPISVELQGPGGIRKDEAVANRPIGETSGSYFRILPGQLTPGSHSVRFLLDGKEAASGNLNIDEPHTTLTPASLRFYEAGVKTDVINPRFANRFPSNALAIWWELRVARPRAADSTVSVLCKGPDGKPLSSQSHTVQKRSSTTLFSSFFTSARITGECNRPANWSPGKYTVEVVDYFRVSVITSGAFEIDKVAAPVTEISVYFLGGDYPTQPSIFAGNRELARLPSNGFFYTRVKPGTVRICIDGVDKNCSWFFFADRYASVRITKLGDRYSAADVSSNEPPVDFSIYKPIGAALIVDPKSVFVAPRPGQAPGQ